MEYLAGRGEPWGWWASECQLFDWWMQVEPQIESPACSLLLLSFAEKLSGNFIRCVSPYCGHFQLHKWLWPLDRIGLHLELSRPECICDCLVRLAIAMNHADRHFKFQEQWSWDVNGTGGQNEESLYFLCSDHICLLNLSVHYWPYNVSIPIQST